MNRPEKNEYAPYYSKYIELVPDGDVLQLLSTQIETVKKLLQPVDEQKSKFRYAEDKWSIREVIGHLLDGERIFAYRALKIARNDKTEIDVFDQNSYVSNSNHDNILLKDLIEEFENVRKGNILLFKSFTDEMFLRTGIVGKNNISVRAIVYIMAGHFIHHLNVIAEKYF